jgi:hypothetical protein
MDSLVQLIFVHRMVIVGSVRIVYRMNNGPALANVSVIQVISMMEQHSRLV